MCFSEVNFCILIGFCLFSVSLAMHPSMSADTRINIAEYLHHIVLGSTEELKLPAEMNQISDRSVLTPKFVSVFMCLCFLGVYFQFGYHCFSFHLTGLELQVLSDYGRTFDAVIWSGYGF